MKGKLLLLTTLALTISSCDINLVSSVSDKESVESTSNNSEAISNISESLSESNSEASSSNLESNSQSDEHSSSNLESNSQSDEHFSSNLESNSQSEEQSSPSEESASQSEEQSSPSEESASQSEEQSSPSEESSPSISESTSQEETKNEIEILQDTDFNNLSSYTIWGDSITANKVGNNLVLSIQNNNPTENWSTQFLQKGLTFPKGEYTLTIELTSSITRKVDVIVQKDGTNGIYDVTTQSTESLIANQQRTITLNFTKEEMTSNMQVAFLTGKVANEVITDPHTITISKLSLTCITDEEIKNPSTDVNADWKMTFNDEFDGNAVDESKWEFQIGDGSSYGVWRWGNNEQQYYRKENATVSDGTLKITAKKETFGGLPYTSTRMRTYGKFSQTYGKFEARVKLPAGQGLWPAFWMLPEDSVYGGWPDSGEIDIMEARGRQLDRYDTTLHYSNNGHQYATKSVGGLNITDWHVYGIIWEADYICWTLDDSVVYTLYSSTWSTDNKNNAIAGAYSPFDQNFHILLNFAVGGNYDGGIVPESNFVSANMEVDYIRAYQKA